jgi:hypothetical protein
MFYYRPDRFDDPGGGTAVDAASDVKAASDRVKALRARAQRYRDLATSLYNQELVAEVENLARELEEEAARLERESQNLPTRLAQLDFRKCKRNFPFIAPYNFRPLISNN